MVQAHSKCTFGTKSTYPEPHFLFTERPSKYVKVVNGLYVVPIHKDWIQTAFLLKSGKWRELEQDKALDVVKSLRKPDSQVAANGILGTLEGYCNYIRWKTPTLSTEHVIHLAETLKQLEPHLELLPKIG